MDDIERDCLKEHFYYLRLHKLMPENFDQRVTFRDFVYANLYYPIAVYWVLASVHLYKAYGDPSMDLTIDVLVLLSLTFDMYVFIIYYLKLKHILPFFKDLTSVFKFGKPSNLGKLIAKQNRNMKYLYICTIFMILIYSFYSYYTNEQCERKASGEGAIHSCALLLPLWLPYGVLSHFYVRLLVFVVQTVFVLCWLLPPVAATYCIASITELMTVRVVHLKGMLKEISEEPSVKEKQNKLIICARYHVDIVELVNQSYLCFGTLNSAHFFLSSVTLGLLYYRILKMFLLKDILQVNGWLFCISVLCYTGQQIINESESLLSDVYSLEWPDMDNHSKDCIRFMMLRMQTPLNIGAGIFYSYSNEFLLRIVQGSYTYVTVMNSLFSKNKADAS